MTQRNAIRNGARRRAIKKQVLARDQACYLCGGRLGPLLPPDTKIGDKYHPLSAVVDEVIPRSAGGSPYDPNNCRAAHRWCNAIKGAADVGTARRRIYERLGLRERDDTGENGKTSRRW